MSSALERSSIRRLGPHGITAAVLLLVTGCVLLLSCSSLLAALLTPGASSAAAADARDRESDAFRVALDAHRAQFDGRSIFFVPGPPPPPQPPPRADVENTAPPPPPPPPSTYGGPKLIGMVNGVAWFEGGTRLSPGEEKRGVRVIRLDPPWEATVEWEGVTFTVSLFARDALISPRKPEPAPAPPDSRGERPAEPSAPPIDPQPPEPEPPTEDPP